MEYDRGRAAEILEDWRAVERDLQDPDIGPAMKEILEAKAFLLRDSYQASVAAEAPAVTDRPSPEPLPSV